MRTNSRITLVLAACGLLGALAWFRPWVNHEPPLQSGAPLDKPEETDTAKPAVRLPVANRSLSTAKEAQATAVNTPAVAVNAHLRDYEASDNLAQLVASLEDDVRAGDTAAAWIVADALYECAMQPSPVLRQRSIEAAKTGPAEYRESKLRHYARQEQRCKPFGPDLKALDERQMAARMVGANGNDLITQAKKLAESPGSFAPGDAKNLLRQIAESHDPWAIWTMADVLGPTATEYGFDGPYANSVETVLAWKFVACRLGYPCGPDSAEVRTLCATGGQCLSEGYEGIMREYRMTPHAFKSSAAVQDELLRLIAVGDVRKIFP